MEEASAPPVSVVPFETPARTPFGGLRQVSRWLYTQNPFYLLSAWLVFFGLRWSFGPGTSLESSAALFAGLLSYTLILALSSIVVVRFARVWDDARSMLLLVVLLFIGTSVALDETLVQRPDLGRIFYLAAWGAAAVCSEGVLYAIRLRLPGWYRFSYHAILALFFTYPVLLTPWVRNPADPALRWLLFGFTPCAAIGFALLWPAVRRGGEYLRGNGSPWPWPLYPWSLFAILALCVAGRAYYLCYSLHFVGRGATIFGPYFLLPLAWCLSWLWLTGAARAERQGIAAMLLLAPIAWCALAVMHRSDALYQSFLREVVETLHVTPLFLNLLAALAYFLYARRRHVIGAEIGLTATLAACSMVAPNSMTFGDVIHVQVWPWAAGAAWFAWSAWRQRSELRWLLCMAFLSMAIDRGWVIVAPDWHWTITYHVLLLAVLIVGGFAHAEFAQWLRRNAGPLLFLAAWPALWSADSPIRDWSAAAQVVYVVALAGAAMFYAWLLQLRVYALTSAAILTAACVLGVWPWYARAREATPGIDAILIGLMSLGLGLAVSLGKAGYWRNARDWLRTRRNIESPVMDSPAGG